MVREHHPDSIADQPIIQKVEILYRLLGRYERVIDPNHSRIGTISLRLLLARRSDGLGGQR